MPKAGGKGFGSFPLAIGQQRSCAALADSTEVAMMRSRTLGAAGIFVLPLLLLSASATALPEATIKACKTPPKIDGELNDACWQAAASFSDFQQPRGKGKPAYGTRVKAGFDSDWLYFGIACEHSAPDKMEANVKTHDAGVHQDESLEFFIDPGTGGAVYGHFMLNVINTQAEQLSTAGARNRGWDPRWLSATKTHAKGWNAEVAIPLYILAAYGDLARTRINVARNGGGQPSTWSPVSGGFHAPSTFGPLKGLAGLRPRIPYLGFGNAKVGRYYPAKGKFQYDVSMDVGADPNTARTVKIVVTDKPEAGKGATVTRTLKLLPGKPQAIKIPVPVDDQGKRETLVTLIDAAAGKELQAESLASSANLDVIKAYLDRSYYTTEKEAKVICAIDLPIGLLKSASLSLSGGQGSVLARSGKVAPDDNRMSLDVSHMKPGAYPIRIDLRSKGGELLAVKRVTLTKRAPNPGREWKLDRVNRVLLRDGKPYFPFGILLNAYNSEIMCEELHYRRAAEMGFNSIVTWCGRMRPEDADTFMQLAAKHKLNVLGWAAGYMAGIELDNPRKYFAEKDLPAAKEVFSNTPNRVKAAYIFNPAVKDLSPEVKVELFDEYFRKNVSRVTEAVNRMKKYSNLIGYKMFDEPTGKKHFAMYEGGRKLYRLVHDTDGYHPAFIIYSSYIPEGEEFVDWTDVLGTDPYWVPGGRRTDLRSTPNFVSKIVALTDARAAERRQVTWTVPLAEWWVATSKRPLLRQEQFCQTYLALIHGARAIFYFRYPLRSRITMGVFAELSKQMEVLGPVATSPAIPQEIEYNPGAFNPLKNTPENYPCIQVSLKRNPAGGYVLLAANTRSYPVEATYRVSLLGERGTVGRLFSDDTYKVRNGAFFDELEKMGTRAYAFKSSKRINAPVTIKVEMEAHRDEGVVETGAPVTGRVGKKNLMPNPSYEETTFPDWPDYFICRTQRLGEDFFLGDKDGGVVLDTENPFHGKVSLKLVSKKHGGTWTMAEVWPKEPEPTEYVFSVYMKADRDGLQAGWFGFNQNNPKVKLTTKWKRYYIKGSVPFHSYDNPLWGVRTDDVGTMWVDALQLERGSEPTEFEP